MNSHAGSETLAFVMFRIILALFYIIAGALHIKSPAGFIAITPDWVPFPKQLVFWTGIAELAGGIGLLVPPRLIPGVRYAAGIGLAIYAFCVFPANVNHAVNNIAVDGITLSWAYHAPRLMLQPVIIWWALLVGGVIRWPFK